MCKCSKPNINAPEKLKLEIAYKTLLCLQRIEEAVDTILEHIEECEEFNNDEECVSEECHLEHEEDEDEEEEDECACCEEEEEEEDDEYCGCKNPHPCRL